MLRVRKGNEGREEQSARPKGFRHTVQPAGLCGVEEMPPRRSPWISATACCLDPQRCGRERRGKMADVFSNEWQRASVTKAKSELTKALDEAFRAAFPLTALLELPSIEAYSPSDKNH